MIILLLWCSDFLVYDPVVLLEFLKLVHYGFGIDGLSYEQTCKCTHSDVLLIIVLV